jgi:hypothetical protein
MMGRSMTREEAVAILNVKPKSPPAEVHAQFTKLAQMNDEGSPYLASKLNRARAVLVPSSWAPAAEEAFTPTPSQEQTEAPPASKKADKTDSKKKAAGGSAKDIPSGGISWKEMRKRRQEAMSGRGGPSA